MKCKENVCFCIGYLDSGLHFGFCSRRGGGGGGGKKLFLHTRGGGASATCCTLQYI